MKCSWWIIFIVPSVSGFRFTEYLVEAIGALIGCGCGTILAIIYGLSVVREQDSIRPRSSNLAVTGLVLSIIGGKNVI